MKTDHYGQVIKNPDGTTMQEDVITPINSDAVPCPTSAHNKAWEQHFVVPIAKEMKARGVAYLLITIRDDGKAAYVLEPNDKGLATKPAPQMPEKHK